ncbi:MAG: hypothetical protein RG740_02100, partial [Acholeplasmataceae bacterium]|nr:hypothetical protein [Acholeplasmataceae bacterium]
DDDIFNGVSEWWNQKDLTATPQKHLFDIFGVKSYASNIYSIGKGIFAYYNINSHKITTSKTLSSSLYNFVVSVLNQSNLRFKEQNYIKLTRGKYTIVSCMDESINQNAYHLKGIYADMFSLSFEVVRNPKIKVGDVGVFYDTTTAQDGDIIGSTYRILKYEQFENEYDYDLSGKKNIDGYIRVKLMTKPKCVMCDKIPLIHQYDDDSQTLLIHMNLKNDLEKIKIFT